MYCKNCGNQIGDDVRFCPECGQNLQSTTSETTQKEGTQSVTNNNVQKENTQSTQKEKKSAVNQASYQGKRTTEFVLGLIGGILGLFSAVSVMFFGGLVDAFSSSSSGLGSLGVAALLFSIMGIVGSIMVKKSGKLGGFLMILAAAGGFISVFMGYIVSGALLLIGGIMSIKKPDQNPMKVKWKIWLPIGIITSILIFLISFAGSGESSPSSPSSTTEDAYSMNEEVEIGNLVYIVNDVATSNTFSDEFTQYTTEGAFLAVDVTVINHGKESVTVDSSMFKIVEDDGTIYDPSSELNSWDLFLDSLNPKTQSNYTVIFELPSASAPYMLQVSEGLFSSKTANIDLATNANSSNLEELNLEQAVDENTQDDNSEVAVEDEPSQEEPSQQENFTTQPDHTPTYYTSTVFIEETYIEEEGNVLEWLDDNLNYVYGVMSSESDDYTNLVVEIEYVDNGKTLTNGTPYFDITSIEEVSIKADDYSEDTAYYEDYWITAEEAESMLSVTYPEYTVVNYPEYDYGTQMAVYYYFELYDETDEVAVLFVEDITGDFYSAKYNENDELIPDALWIDN